MLTTGIASGDTSSYAQLLASLQQTGLVQMKHDGSAYVAT